MRLLLRDIHAGVYNVRVREGPQDPIVDAIQTATVHGFIPTAVLGYSLISGRRMRGFTGSFPNSPLHQRDCPPKLIS